MKDILAIVLTLTVAACPLIQSGERASAQTNLSSIQSQAIDRQTVDRDLNVNAFTATLTPGGVVLQWRTTNELNNLGFNIYRVRNEQRTRANRSLILGSVFKVSANAPQQTSYSYSWFDSAGTSDSTYYIEAVGADGTRRLYETAAAASNEKLPEPPQAQAITRLAGDPSQLVSEHPASISANAFQPQGTIQNQWAIAGQSALKIQIKKDGWYRVTQQQAVAAGFNPTVDVQNLSLYLNGAEIAIRTSKSSGQFSNGDYFEFYGQGLDIKESDTRVYYLIAGTEPGRRIAGAVQTETLVANVPIAPTFEYRGSFSPLLNLINGEPIASAKDESSQMPAVAPARQRSDEPSAYPFAVDPVPHLKPAGMVPADEVIEPSAVPAEPIRSRPTQSAAESPVAVRNAPVVARRHQRRPRRKLRKPKRRYAHATAGAPSFNNTVQITERVNYVFSLLNGDAQNYFGQPVYSFGTATDTLAIHSVETTAAGPALLEVAVQGVSITNHVVSVFFNDVLVGTVTNYFGLGHGVQSFNIPVSSILEGNNTVKMTAGAGDVGLVDYVKLTYPHKYSADSDSLRFSLRYDQSAVIDGFSIPNVMLLDISDPANVKAANPTSQVSGAGYAIDIKRSRSTTVGIPEQQPTRTLYALPQGQFLQPAALSLNQSSTLNLAANGADLLIISYKDFIPSLSKSFSPINTSFVAQRNSQGLSTQIVDIEDVYDEFSYGTHTVQAMVDFLSLAATTWTKKPRYLLLLGDASYDPRNYEGFGAWDLVPTKHVDTLFEDTCTDELLADFDGNGISDIPLGRLPARTVAEADLMLSKIVNFSKANVPQTAMLVADAQDGYYFNFADSNVAVAAQLPQPQLNVQFVNRGENHTSSTDAATRTMIINNFNQGVALANYSGHGNVDTWTGANLFTAPDARGLTNGNKLGLVVVADCLNGLFDDRALEGIGEAFVKAPNGGAVATFSSSGKTTPEGQQAMAQRLYQLIYGSQPATLGDAIKEAKTFTTDLDVRHTWILLGDPTMKVF